LGGKGEGEEEQQMFRHETQHAETNAAEHAWCMHPLWRILRFLCGIYL
jgi:hypothetical protein